MRGSVGPVLRHLALVAVRGCAVVVGTWLAWSLLIAVYIGVGLLLPADVQDAMVSPALALLVMLGYLVTPVLAGVACSRWILDGSWRRVFHPWEEP